MKKLYFLILSLLLMLSACGKDSAPDLSLFSTREKDNVTILDATEAASYLDTVGDEIQKGTRSGIYNNQVFSSADSFDQCQYALYTGVQNHGKAFSVSLNVLTVYDGTTESVGMAWFDDKPNQMESYEIQPNLFDNDKTVEENELIFVSAYTISIPKGEISEKSLTQSNYELSSDGNYCATDHLILVMDSAFSK